MTKIWNELPDSVVNAPNVNTFKNRLDRRQWREEDFLYNHEAPIDVYKDTTWLRTGLSDLNTLI